MMESCAHKFKMHLQLKMEMFEAGQGNNLQQWRRNLGDYPYIKKKWSLYHLNTLIMEQNIMMFTLILVTKSVRDHFEKTSCLITFYFIQINVYGT